MMILSVIENDLDLNGGRPLDRSILAWHRTTG